MESREIHEKRRHIWKIEIYIKRGYTWNRNTLGNGTYTKKKYIQSRDIYQKKMEDLPGEKKQIE